MSGKVQISESKKDRVSELDISQLRWRCPESWLDFESSEAVEPATGVEGQKTAVDALRFGLHCRGLGQNIYVRGLRGGGRLRLVAELVRSLGGSPCDSAEYAYVRNFSAPERPRLLALPQGTGESFRRKIRELCDFIVSGLPDALKTSAVHNRLEEAQEDETARVESATKSLKEALDQAGLELVSVEQDGQERPALLPLIKGSPVKMSELDGALESGQITEERFQEIHEAIERFEPQMSETITRVGRILQLSAARKRQLSEGPARWILIEATSELRVQFPGADVGRFLDDIMDDVIENRLQGAAVEAFDAVSVYGVHLLEDWSSRESFPVIVENHPTLANLTGSVEAPYEQKPDRFAMQAGSILRANGGCLILDARDVRSEPNSWKVLVRTLSSGRLEILPPELGGPTQAPPLKPDPIPVDVRVILVGDAKTFRDFDQTDEDFSDLFKVLSDFDSTVERTLEGARLYAGVLSRLTHHEKLPPFDSTAVAAIIEQGARLSDRPGRLTAHFTKIEDIAREAAFLAGSIGQNRVLDEHVVLSIERARRRADLPARRYRSSLKRGTYNVETKGWVAGQVNGLAVMKAGQVTYGFPARLTVSAGPGDRGIIDIESRSALSGSIHTKWVHILDGLVRQLLKADFPLTFTASLAFEQSYGNIEGDSASGAEICCLFSSLADIPINQGFAMTGSIDQRGHVQAVGGVNDKIEGFFDACSDAELTGEQGVIIPRANVDDLMLREDVVQACENGQFRIHAVAWIQEALEILTGVPAGVWKESAGFQSDSVLGRARAKAREFWKQSTRRIARTKDL
jgi:ATP-dependent Lon protease